MNKKILVGGSIILLTVFFFVFIKVFNQNNTTTQMIGESTTYATITTNFQRKTFYANNYHWIFYCNGSHISYTTSDDGSNWDTPTVINEGVSSSGFSVWYDGDVHYAYSSGAPGNPVTFRRGSLSDNEIVWEVEQTVVEGSSGHENYNPYVALDSDAYPWISYFQYDGYNYSSWVVKAQDLDGNGWDDPTRISDFSHAWPWRTVVLPLEGGKIYAIYAYSQGSKGRLWNGSSWETEEVITTITPQQDYGYTAVSHDNTIHFAALESDSYDVWYFNYTFGRGWNDGEIIQRSQSSVSFPSLSVDKDANIMYAIWVHDDDVFMKKRVNGAWDDTSVSTTPSGVSYESLVGSSCFYETGDRKIGVALVEVKDHLYNLKYHYISIP